MIDPSEIVKAMVQRQAEFAARPDSTVGVGEATEFACRCGGVMHRFDPHRVEYERLKKEAGRPRYSRRKRQAKKNAKKWREKLSARLFLTATLVRPLRSPMGFVCIQCGSRQGFYQMMAKSMLQIEPVYGGQDE